MDKAKDFKVVLTFKQTERYIYDEIQKHSGKGNWIKDILKAYLDENKKGQNRPM